MNNQTIEKLHQMRLHTMAVAFKEELERPNNTELTFEDRLQKRASHGRFS